MFSVDVSIVFNRLKEKLKLKMLLNYIFTYIVLFYKSYINKGLLINVTLNIQKE